MPDITIKVRGADAVKEFISSLPRRVRGVATEAMAEYFIGNGRHGLKHEPAYKRLYRRDVYKDVYFMAKDGHKVYGFSSLQQLRKVAMIVQEKPPGTDHRTHAYRDSWKAVLNGAKTYIMGSIPHEKWVDRFSGKVGWREPMDIISTNIKGAVQAAERAVGKILGNK